MKKDDGDGAEGRSAEISQNIEEIGITPWNPGLVQLVEDGVAGYYQNGEQQRPLFLANPHGKLRQNPQNAEGGSVLELIYAKKGEGLGQMALIGEKEDADHSGE